jgi:hypothetical protein
MQAMHGMTVSCRFADRKATLYNKQLLGNDASCQALCKVTTRTTAQIPHKKCPLTNADTQSGQVHAVEEAEVALQLNDVEGCSCHRRTAKHSSKHTWAFSAHKHSCKQDTTSLVSNMSPWLAAYNQAGVQEMVVSFVECCHMSLVGLPLGQSGKALLQ